MSELVQQARRCPDEARCARLLDEAVLQARPLATPIARRYRRRGIEDQDLDQVAMLGLCKAVRGFQPARGTGFAAYAVPTITGEIRRHFRDAGWLVRPTRSLQELGAALHSAEERLGQRNGRPPSAAETAAYLCVPVRRVEAARQAERGFRAASLDSPHRDTGQPVGATLAAPDELEHVDAALVVGPALATLTPRERHIVRLRYVHGLTQEQIGADIGVSQMQVSRLLRQVLAKLRRRIGVLAEPA